MRAWRTADRPEAEQYGYWREVVCEAFTALRPAARGTRDSWNRTEAKRATDGGGKGHGRGRWERLR